MGQDLYHYARQVAEYSQPKLLAACMKARKFLVNDGPLTPEEAELVAELDRAIASAHIA